MARLVRLNLKGIEWQVGPTRDSIDIYVPTLEIPVPVVDREVFDIIKKEYGHPAAARAVDAATDLIVDELTVLWIKSRIGDPD